MGRFNFIRNLSVKYKITLIILFVAFTVITSGFVFLSFLNSKRVKNEIQNQLILETRLVGEYSVVPLVFEDRNLAQQTLSGLKFLDVIEKGILLDKSGQVFVTYPDSIQVDASDTLRIPEEVIFKDGLFRLSEPVIFEGNTIGRLIIVANSGQLRDQNRSLILILLAVFVFMLGLSVLLAFRLQRIITDPILRLADLTKDISQSHNYSVSLNYEGNNEIQTLYKQFGNLLKNLAQRQEERDKAENELKLVNEKLGIELNERKIIESNLRVSEERYRYLFESNPAPMAIYDPVSLEFLSVNDAFLNHYGYSKEEALALKLPDYHPEEEREEMVNVVRGLTGLTHTEDWHHVKKDGSIMGILTTSHDIRYMGRRARIVVITDITARQKAEKEIRFLAQVIRNINECVSITDTANNVVFVNQSWIRTFGYSEEEILGKNISKIVSERNPPGITAEVLNATLQGGWQGELINRRKDGSEFPVMLFTTIIFDENNKPFALVGISSDITEHKKNELELLKYRDHLEELVRERTLELDKAIKETQDLYNNAPCGYHSINDEGTYVRMNNTELKWLGYERDELIGKLKVTDTLAPDSRAKFLSLLEEFLKKGEMNNVEFEYLRKDGTTFFGSLNATSIYDSESRFLMTLSTVFDITERKKFEAELARARIDAENANTAKSEFLANMSHEIRTPLNAVLGYTELLSALLSDKTQQNYIESIKSSGRSLLTLINDILDLSKIEAGKLELEYDYVDSHYFFSEFERIFSLKASERGVQLIVDIRSGTPSGIYIDEPRLRQIIFNLIGNAIKFTNQGYVKLIVMTDNLHTVHYTEKKSEEFIDLIIEVEDTGIGISKELLSEIFDPFVQEGGSKNIGGTGLGLAITRRLTNLMKGSISLKSELGKGSTFTVMIPDISFKRDFVSTRTTIQIDPASIKFKKAKILVVDDVEQNRNFIRDTLRNTPLVILEASDGFKALEIARSELPDLIISDIRMPHMDGFELLSRLKEDDKLKSIPVVAYSASVLKDQKERIHRSQFAGLLAKPLNISELFLELMNHIPFTETKARKVARGEVDLNDEKVVNIDGLINTLETSIQAEWQKFERRQPIGEIRVFGDSLTKLGEKHKSARIENYGAELVTAADSFNIEAILNLLKQFTVHLDSLKSVRNERNKN